MKTARYGDQEVEYDETAPCWICGLPVIGASAGGTVVCPWCDCGRRREGGLYPNGKSYCTECGARVVAASTGRIVHPCGHKSKIGWHHPHPFGPCDCLQAPAV